MDAASEIAVDDVDELERRRQADALCLECGLCCDGTLFGSVAVADYESENLVRIGLPVVSDDGALMMAQPCSAFRNCSCDVYDDRPKACQKYECTLRERLIAGSTNDASARASLARMRELLATTRAAFDLPTTSIWEALLAIEEPVVTDPMSAAGRRFDAGVEAVSELLELARVVFEPNAGGDQD